MSQWFDEFQLLALGAMRETAMALEFAEQGKDAIEQGAFKPSNDTELESAQSAIMAVQSFLHEMSELLDAQSKEAAK